MAYVSVVRVATIFAAQDARNTRQTTIALMCANRAVDRASVRPLEGSEPR